MLNPCETTPRRRSRDELNPLPGAVHLPGFVEASGSGNKVTYESHQFWVELEISKSGRHRGARLWVEHGGGVEILEVRHMFSQPLAVLIAAGEMQSAFKLCWGIFELARDARQSGIEECRREMKTAFVEGRLKKRKNRGSNCYKVWVEPAQVAP